MYIHKQYEKYTYGEAGLKKYLKCIVFSLRKRPLSRLMGPEIRIIYLTRGPFSSVHAA